MSTTLWPLPRTGRPGPIAALRWVRHRILRARRIRRYLRQQARPRLHLGCGMQAIEGWLDTDVVPQVPGAVFLDARQRFPFPDGCFRLVFCEHLIEHLTREEGERMLRECFRVLAAGGLIRIATPDLRFLIALYSPCKTELQERYLEWALRHSRLPDPGARREVSVINNFFRAWQHRFIYDFETLAALLRRVGFSEIEPCAVGESACAGLRNLESHGKVIPEEFNRVETFVVEARKPAGIPAAGRSDPIGSSGGLG